MRSWTEAISILAPSLILGISVWEDMRTKKVRNETVLVCAVFALFSVLLISGFDGLSESLLSGGTALFISVPIVLLGILGAGDMKIFIAVALAVTWPAVITVFISALVWGGIFGLLQIVFSGGLQKLAHNMYQIAIERKPIERRELHAIPYTVALAFGWITHLTLQNFGAQL